MQSSELQNFSDRLQHEGRTLLNGTFPEGKGFKSITETGREEFEKQAQRERNASVLESRDEMAQNRLAEIGAALARIQHGTFATAKTAVR